MKDLVSHPYKIIGKIMHLHVLFFSLSSFLLTLTSAHCSPVRRFGFAYCSSKCTVILGTPFPLPPINILFMWSGELFQHFNSFSQQWKETTSNPALSFGLHLDTRTLLVPCILQCYFSLLPSTWRCPSYLL